VCCRRTFNLV